MFNVGKWVEIIDRNRELFIASGGIVPSSTLIAKNVFLCVPVHISPNVTLHNNVKIDKFSFLNWGTIIYPNVYIGSYSSIGRQVQVGLAEHPKNWLSTHTFQYNSNWFPDIPDYKFPRKHKWLHHKKTRIGSDVWIGNGAQIRCGVTINHGSIIGAGSIVTKDIPAYSIAVGVPARVIKYRFSDEIISRLLKVKWWDLSLNKLAELDFSDIESSLTRLECESC
jgi:virginiamycin A acetyltransferase